MRRGRSSEEEKAGDTPSRLIGARIKVLVVDYCACA
jgi:hypothetical protein